MMGGEGGGGLVPSSHMIYEGLNGVMIKIDRLGTYRKKERKHL